MSKCTLRSVWSSVNQSHATDVVDGIRNDTHSYNIESVTQDCVIVYLLGETISEMDKLFIW